MYISDQEFPIFNFPFHKNFTKHVRKISKKTIYKITSHRHKVKLKKDLKKSKSDRTNLSVKELRCRVIDIISPLLEKLRSWNGWNDFGRTNLRIIVRHPLSNKKNPNRFIRLNATLPHTDTQTPFSCVGIWKEIHFVHLNTRNKVTKHTQHHLCLGGNVYLECVYLAAMLTSRL